MVRDDRTGGAGRSGGLGFLVVLAVLAYVAVTTLGGVARWVAFGVLVLVVVVLGVNVLRRR